MIRAATGAYAAGVLERLQASDPDFAQRPGRADIEFAKDTEMRLLYLAAALETECPELFGDHLVWSRSAMAARDFDREYLVENVRAIGAELQDSLPQSRAAVQTTIDQGMAALAAANGEPPTLLADGRPHVDLLRRLLLAVLEGRDDDSVDLIKEAVDSGVPVGEMYQHVLGPAQVELGRMWQIGEIHTAEEHFGSRTTERCLNYLRERMPRPGDSAPAVISAAVGGEFHSIAVRFVADHFAMAGWRAIVLGADQPAADLAGAAADFEADLVAISVSLALHIDAARESVLAVRRDPRTTQLPVLVGGRPFTLADGLWRVVGADGCAGNAIDAVRVGTDLVDRARSGGSAL